MASLAGRGEPPPLSKPSPLGPSFAAVTKGRPDLIPPTVKLAPRHYGTKDGKPLVSFTQSELQPGIQRLQHSLIAKFSAGRPPIEDVRRQLSQAWGLENPATIGAMDARHVLIILPSAPLSNRILAHPTRKIGNYLFRLFRWSQDFKRNKEPTTTTSWIRLPGLPAELFNAGYLEAFASPIGRYLAIDESTRTCRNPSFARVCIELDLQQPMPKEIWIVPGASEGFWQAIEFENKLLYCTHCKLHGHQLTNCRKRGGRRTAGEDMVVSQLHRQDTRRTKMEKMVVGLEARVSMGASPRPALPQLHTDSPANPELSSISDKQGWTLVQKKKHKKKDGLRTVRQTAQRTNDVDMSLAASSVLPTSVPVSSSTTPYLICKDTTVNRVSHTPIGDISQSVAGVPFIDQKHVGSIVPFTDSNPKDNASKTDDGNVPCTANQALIKDLAIEKAFKQDKSPLNVSATPFRPGLSPALNHTKSASSPSYNTSPEVTLAEECEWIPARKVKQLRKGDKIGNSPIGSSSPQPPRNASLTNSKLIAESPSINIRDSDINLQEGEKMAQIIEGYNNLIADLTLSEEDKILIKSSCNHLVPSTQNALPPLTMYSPTRDLDVAYVDKHDEDPHYFRRANPYID